MSDEYIGVIRRTAKTLVILEELLNRAKDGDDRVSVIFEVSFCEDEIFVKLPTHCIPAVLRTVIEEIIRDMSKNFEFTQELFKITNEIMGEEESN